MKLLSAIILTVAVSTMSVYAEQVFGAWSITTAQNADISATCSNPKTSLGIEEAITIRLTNLGIPRGGSAKFRNGFERELTPGETSFYWNDLNGTHAFWSYLETQGKLIAIHPEEGTIPDHSFGKITRIVTRNDKELFGILARVSGNPNEFSLVIDGACCGPVRFEKNAVALMQQMNFTSL
jgi:hypothetical protein